MQKKSKKTRWLKSNKFSCEGKLSFTNYYKAEEYNKRQQSRNAAVAKKGKRIEKLHVYKCEQCGRFHIGHAARRHLLSRDFSLKNQ